MKIYTEIIVDMRTDEVLHETSFEYDGPVSQCGSMGGGGTDTVDEEYNARMASIAEAQQEMSDEMFNFYKYGSLEGPSKEYNVGGQWLSESDAQDYLYSQQGGDAPAQAGGDFGTWLNRSAESVKRPQGQPGRGEGRGSGFKSTSNEYLIDGQWMSYNQARDYYENGPAAGTVNLGGYDTRTTGDGGTSYLDLEKMKIDANAGLIPLQTDLEKSNIGLQQSQISSMEELLPYQTGAQKAGLRYDKAQSEEMLGLVPLWGDAEETKLNTSIARNEDTIIGMRERAPVRREFYHQAMEGVNPETWADAAGTDVAAQYSNASGNLRRNLSAMGLNPNSGRFLEGNKDLELDKAKNIAGARTQGRRAGEERDFQMKSQALGLKPWG